MAEPTCPKCGGHAFGVHYLDMGKIPTPACTLFYCTDCGHIVGSGNPWVSIVQVESPLQVEVLEHVG